MPNHPHPWALDAQSMLRREGARLAVGEVGIVGERDGPTPIAAIARATTITQHDSAPVVSLHVRVLAVALDAQGGGLGRETLSNLIAFAGEHHLDVDEFEVHSMVHSENAASQALMRRFGLRPITLPGTQNPYQEWVGRVALA